MDKSIYEKTESSVLINANSHTILLVPFELTKIEFHGLIRHQFFEFWSSVVSIADFTTLQINQSKIIVNLGYVDISKEDIPSFINTMISKINSFGTQLPADLHIRKVSGYETPIHGSDEAVISKDKLSFDGSTDSKLLAIRKISYLNNSTKLIQSLLEDDICSILLTTYSKSNPVRYYISFKISGKNRSELDVNQNKIVSILKTSKNIEGELIAVKHKYIKENFGKVQLGLHNYPLADTEISPLLDLLYKALNAQERNIVPTPYPYIRTPKLPFDVDDHDTITGNGSEPDVISDLNCNPGTSSSIELVLFKKITRANGWKINNEIRLSENVIQMDYLVENLEISSYHILSSPTPMEYDMINEIGQPGKSADSDTLVFFVGLENIDERKLSCEIDIYRYDEFENLDPSFPFF